MQFHYLICQERNPFSVVGQETELSDEVRAFSRVKRSHVPKSLRGDRESTVEHSGAPPRKLDGDVRFKQGLHSFPTFTNKGVHPEYEKLQFFIG